jgi:protein-S-isoprenylcysteine O-methyltransferase Ste14
MHDPRDGLWHLGRLVRFERDGTDMEMVKDNLRAWAIKAFFLAFMVSVMPGSVGGVLLFDLRAALSEPVAAVLFVVRIAFLFDVCFGTIGYILTMRPLDAQIRSANPYLSAWVAALVCYPPFALMGAGGPLDYRSGALEWMDVFAGMDVVLVPWGIAVAACAVVYAWATVVFGFRFSNLTHRGIITAGPYRYAKHPAYVAKNLMWWLVHVPFLGAASAEEGVRNALLLLTVNVIYLLRARTEERHLMADPAYRAYAAWIAEHGVLERLWRRMTGRRPGLSGA